MWSFSSFDDPSPHGLVLSTLESFDSVATFGGVAVLYPRRYARATPMAQNLHAAVAATVLGLSSLDYARRRYTDSGRQAERDETVDRYTAAYAEAKNYMRACLESTNKNATVELGFGRLAASVALERLGPSLLAAQLMYRLGLNYEGDAVARQVLEQIAWAVAASEFTEEGRLSALRTTGAVRDLKKLVPYAGEMYGRLSNTTHASLREHRRIVRLDGENVSILLTWRRFAWSALTLLQLADLWVVAYEWTQRQNITKFAALDPDNDYAPRSDREFLERIRILVESIEDAEQSTSPSGPENGGFEREGMG